MKVQVSGRVMDYIATLQSEKLVADARWLTAVRAALLTAGIDIDALPKDEPIEFSAEPNETAIATSTATPYAKWYKVNDAQNGSEAGTKES